MTRLSIDIPEELHHYLKIHTAHRKETIMNFVRQAICNKIDQEKVPNKQTVRALKESRNGIGVTRNVSVKEMMHEIYKELEQEGFKTK